MAYPSPFAARLVIGQATGDDREKIIERIDAFVLSDGSRNTNAWLITTFAQTLGCRIPLVRTVILGYRSLT
jgi:hypothetical protein